MSLFYYFNFERNYNVLKSKSPYFLLNKNVNYNQNEMESKMENSTHSFRKTNFVLRLLQESRIKKSKTVMSWRSRKKKEGAFCTAYFVRKKFYQHLYFFSMYSVLNKLSKIHILLHTKKTVLLIFKIVESLQCILKSKSFPKQTTRYSLSPKKCRTKE